MNRDDPQQAMLEDALAAYRAEGDHRKGMIAALAAANLWEPEWLEPALNAWNGVVGRRISREQAFAVAMRRALEAVQDLAGARERQRLVTAGGTIIRYGRVPLLPRPWPQPPGPDVTLYPSGTISAGSLFMDRAGATELVRLLQLALRDQAALQADSV